MSSAQFSETHLVTIRHMCSALGKQEAWSLIFVLTPLAQLHLVDSFARHGENARQDIAAQAQSLASERDAALQEVADLNARGRALEDTLHHTTARMSAQTASKPKQRAVKLEVPKYGGLASHQLLRWIKQVSRAADALNIDDDEIRVSFAMSHLTGRVDDWAWGLTCEDGFAFSNFDDFIEQLKAAFLPANSDFRYRAEYLSARQGKRSIREYVHDLRFLASCVTQKSSLSEETKVTIFMNGLNDSAARTQLFRTYPSTFEDAVRTALAEEFSVLQSRTTTKTRDPHDMEVSAMTSPTTDRRCLNCNRPGHFSRECRQPRRAPTCARGTAASPTPRFAHPVVIRARGGARRPAEATEGLPFDRGGITRSAGPASDTVILCQIGRQPSRMLSFPSRISGYDRLFRVLIDSDGATRRASPHSVVRVKMADGKVVTSPKVPVALPTSVGDFVSTEQFYVIDLDDRWDLILGMRWLEKHQPWIDWRSKTMRKIASVYPSTT
ncbi:hypothetical protein AaE_015171 [Aphanomyces astaci]|uniref:CCHC-type domain-containing protein n=1 Tax=Aphanomyces astaci TaxID=112090 RepID=A0A6A4Z4C0_APHAT|nr:hypothetical protein AaE_015171 [Aphanomyces astaci]